VVFSALDSGPAREIEPLFARAGALVFSNASAFRMAPDVPLIIPEVNPEHLELVGGQRGARAWEGAILCNPNCTTTVLTLALAPLHEAFGVEAVCATSMQALSGAGYPGVSGLDALGNVLPHIPGEEEKLESETQKLLGRMVSERIEPAGLHVSAHCNRVAVGDGHTMSVSVRLSGEPSPGSVREVLEGWRPPATQGDLHSAPPVPLRVHCAADRPQVALDVERDRGMSVHVGRIRACPVLGVKFTCLGHNTERGAAGGSILVAELVRSRGLLSQRS
jgi:aspartate-semialdehyde dehydrogenase